MAKKSFISSENPALQFISLPAEQPEEVEEIAETTEESQTDTPKQNESSKTSSTKRAIEEIPSELVSKPTEPPQGYKLNPLYVETKSKRLQLIMQPSLLAKIKDTAKNKGLSVNEYVHQVLTEATKNA